MELTTVQEPKLLRVLLGAHGGRGKTLVAATAPNPVFISHDTQHLTTISQRDFPVIRPETIEDLLVLRSLLSNRELAHKKIGNIETIVLDNIDHTQHMMIAQRKEDERIESFRTEDWVWLGEEMRDLFRGFGSLPYHVFFTVHLKSSEDSETGRRYERPATQGLHEEMSGFVNIALLLRERVVTHSGNRSRVRYAQTYCDESHEWIKDHTANLPLEFPLDFETEFERLYEASFGEKPPEVPVFDSPAISDLEVGEHPSEDEKPSEEPQAALPPIGVSDEVFTCKGPYVERGQGKGECTNTYNQDQHELTLLKHQVSLCKDCAVAVV